MMFVPLELEATFHEPPHLRRPPTEKSWSALAIDIIPALSRGAALRFDLEGGARADKIGVTFAPLQPATGLLQYGKEGNVGAQASICFDNTNARFTSDSRIPALIRNGAQVR